MHKIKKVSLFFRVLLQILFIVMPVLSVYSWIYAPQKLILLQGFIQLDAIPNSYKEHVLHSLSLFEKSTGFLLSLLPLSIMLSILYSLIQLFKLYEIGDIFSMEHVRRIKYIGYALLLGQVIEPFYQLLMGLILTLQNPKGHRFIGITLDQMNIGILLTALLVLLISWIMAEGYKMQDDLRLTI